VSGNSFQRFDTIPSAILFDGVVPLPIYAVTQMSLNETYHLPPLGTNGAQTIVSTHDDTVSLQGPLHPYEAVLNNPKLPFVVFF
jgi:hypothetical protein